MAAHNWELFLFTEGKPISVFSEQSGESQNKYIRAYKSGVACKARQTSSADNIRDIYVRLMLKSDPQIVAKRRLLQCKRCQLFGHTVRSCKENLFTVISEEEERIKSVYL